VSSDPRAHLAIAEGQAAEDLLAPVHRHRVGGTDVITLHGRLPEVAEAGHEALLHALADDPDTVLCDLSGVTGLPDSEAVRLLASVGSEIRQWPGTPVGVVCPRSDLRQSLGRQPDSEFLVIADRRRRVLAGLARRPRPTVVRAPLEPAARSARAARDLVARTCLEWECDAQVAAATLVVSELVTNAMLHAGTDLTVSVARCGSSLRLAVRDANSRRPQQQRLDTSQVTGRGMLLVAAVSEAWGVLPTGDGGKVVWAVLPVGEQGANRHTTALHGQVGAGRRRPQALG
jgi:Histidine kinase-like ATPase domain